MERIEMDEIGTSGRDRPDRGSHGDAAVAEAHVRIDPDATLGIESALESGHIDLKDVVLYLSSRLARVKCRLARLCQATSLLGRRDDDAASRLDELAGHEIPAIGRHGRRRTASLSRDSRGETDDPPNA